MWRYNFSEVRSTWLYSLPPHHHHQPADFSKPSDNTAGWNCSLAPEKWLKVFRRLRAGSNNTTGWNSRPKPQVGGVVGGSWLYGKKTLRFLIGTWFWSKFILGSKFSTPFYFFQKTVFKFFSTTWFRKKIGLKFFCTTCQHHFSANTSPKCFSQDLFFCSPPWHSKSACALCRCGTLCRQE